MLIHFDDINIVSVDRYHVSVNKISPRPFAVCVLPHAAESTAIVRQTLETSHRMMGSSKHVSFKAICKLVLCCEECSEHIFLGHFLYSSSGFHSPHLQVGSAYRWSVFEHLYSRNLQLFINFMLCIGVRNYHSFCKSDVLDACTVKLTVVRCLGCRL